LLLLTLNFVYFAHDYITHYPYEYSGDWQYGYKQSVDYAKSVEKNYDSVEITTALGRPYIYYLFYTKTNPVTFRQTANISRDVFGFVTVNGFEKYHFESEFNYDLNKGKKVLYINIPKAVPVNAKILQKFNLLDGEGQLVAYTI
jgi:hypothetical protein